MRLLISSKRLWLLGVLLLIIAGGIFGYTQLSKQEQAPDDSSGVQTAIARRGDLILLASGSGTLIVSREASVLCFGKE
jgi:hypothetical protein